MYKECLNVCQTKVCHQFKSNIKYFSSNGAAICTSNLTCVINNKFDLR